MPVALQPGTVVDGGRVDLGQPENSGLRGLANSLDVAVRSAADIAATAQENEFKQISALLNDATAGPDEVAEIASNAYFPLNRFAAQNRQGEALVAGARKIIEDDLVNATDPVDARARLRVHQEKLMEGINEPGVQAGVRQAIADMAGPMLNRASAQRVELRNVQRQKDESFILREGLRQSPEDFHLAIQGIFADQNLDATREPDIHETAAQTLLNELVEHPDSFLSVRQAAEGVLAGDTVTDAKDRAQYSAVLKAVKAIEDDKSSSLTVEQEKKALRGVYGQRILESIAANPGMWPDQEDVDGYVANSPDPLAANANIQRTVEASRGRPIGIVGTDAYKNGKDSLKALGGTQMFPGTNVPVPGSSADPETLAYANELYEQITGSMDPRLEPLEANTQAQQAAQIAWDKAAASKAAQKAAEDKLKSSEAEFTARVQKVRATGTAAEKKAVAAELKERQQATGLEARRKDIREALAYARKHGLAIKDLRPF